MLRQFLVGATVCMCNIVIHAMLMTAVVQVAQKTSQKITWRPSLHLTMVMIATVCILMAGHALEVMVWALAYAVVGAIQLNTDFVYFAFVNYTTLGYGDITPVPRWKLLGPITAMNGVLLFGWSTAVIFEVLRKAMELRTPDADNAPGASVFRGTPTASL
jgi:hypothetical protein